jgi:aerobic carbon-monoxide dehydrogenase medium subunit
VTESLASAGSSISGQVTPTALDAAEVLVPSSRDEAVTAFGDGSGFIVFGGGTIVMPDLNYGRLRPARVLALWDAGLRGIQRENGSLTIGAMTTVAELEEAPEPLATMARSVADHEVRAQATIGGNLCAPPGGEYARGDLQAPLIALGARVRSAGAGGERTDAVEDFLADGSGRLVLDVELEEPRRAGHASVRRPHAHAYTILAVCAAETADGVRIGLTGGGARGIRARNAEEALRDGGSPDAAAEAVLRDAEPHDDALASAWYRQRMLPVLVRRALNDLLGKGETAA